MTGPKIKPIVWEDPRKKQEKWNKIVRDWITFDEKNLSMYCTRCHSIYMPSLPLSLGMWSAIARQFTMEHKGCV